MNDMAKPWRNVDLHVGLTRSMPTSASDDSNSEAEHKLDQMMDWAMEKSREGENTILLFRDAFMLHADFHMLMALIGQAGFINAATRLRAKRVRSNNAKQVNSVKRERAR